MTKRIQLDQLDLEFSFVHGNPKPETKPPTTHTTHSYVDGLRKAKQIVEDILKQEIEDSPDWRSEYMQGGIDTLGEAIA